MKQSAITVLICGGAAADLLVTGMAIDRRFFSNPEANTAPGAVESVEISDWSTQLERGHRIGPAHASVVILEHGDFECPACRTLLNGPLRGVRARYADNVAIIFRHLPLSYHKHALPTARAAECAASQGRFEQFHDIAYRDQDWLGRKSLFRMAQESGVRDSLLFRACLSGPAPDSAIEVDIKAANAIGATGTPTVAINGRLLPAVPDSLELDGYVKFALGLANPENQE